MLKDIHEANRKVTPFSGQLETLHRDFPGCFTKAGAFDIERFKEEIGKETAVTDEGYRLDFLGKSYARLLAATRTETLIAPDAEHNAKPENAASGNLYISGDNLDALKHLRESYAGRIKCVYIDPPYNTGSDGFVYNDSFKFSTEDLVEKLNLTTKQAERVAAFSKSGSASHSAWLTFMLPRLALARDLMSDDAAIFISIDDNEQAELKLLCDAIFGEENFVDTIIWEKRYSPQNAVQWFSESHDFILVYARHKEQWAPNLLDRTEEMNARYRNLDNDPRGVWKPTDSTAQGGHGTETQFYTLTAPNGKQWNLPAGRCWLYTEPVMKKMIADNRVWFGEDGNNMPALKRFLTDVKQGIACQTIWKYEEVGHNQEAKQEIKDIFSNHDYFETPKPVRLLKRIVKIGTLSDSLVLDFFSGSGTTAEAVMRLNAEDGGNRKFILVQIPEKVKKGSEAEKAKFKTIDEIGRKRIELAAAKIREENPMFHGDVGYRHYTLVAEPADLVRKMDKFDPKKNDALFGPELEQKIGRDVILQTWFVHDGLGFTPKTAAVDFAGYKAVWAGDYLYLVDGGWTEASTKALFERYSKDVGFSPTKVVLFGYAFDEWNVNTGLKDNLRHLQDTERCLGVTLDVRY